MKKFKLSLKVKLLVFIFNLSKLNRKYLCNLTNLMNI